MEPAMSIPNRICPDCGKPFPCQDERHLRPSVRAGSELRYRDLIDAAGEINLTAVGAMAHRRAYREFAARKQIGGAREYRGTFERELDYVMSIARDLRDARLAEAAHAALPLAEQLARSFELEAMRARNALTDGTFAHRRERLADAQRFETLAQVARAMLPGAAQAARAERGRRTANYLIDGSE
jgi:hypothetical protein